jgi:hypothetical protein
MSTRGQLLNSISFVDPVHTRVPPLEDLISDRTGEDILDERVFGSEAADGP